jgi:hypothetical protein
MFLENILSKLTLTDANSDLHFYTSNWLQKNYE